LLAEEDGVVEMVGEVLQLSARLVLLIESDVEMEY
jgi:hypothetical protein